MRKPEPDAQQAPRTHLQDILQGLTTKQLRELAAEEGVASEAIEEARDSEMPKEALIRLVLELDDLEGTFRRF
eukprot:COSAG03_NODE_27591_length_252_cov_0.830065_1_plen_72_part_10